jgi:hypothetical protein
MSPDQAAIRLRQSGVTFRKIFPETSHGTQGSHLHIEPELTGRPPARLQNRSDETESGSATGIGTEDGIGVFGPDLGQPPVQDFTQAAVWFLKAAAQGNADAQFNLGLLYQNGQGVPKDPSLAIHWYLAAAARGNASAQINLGVLYAKGEGLPQHEAEAARWTDPTALKAASVDAGELRPQGKADAAAPSSP